MSFSHRVFAGLLLASSVLVTQAQAQTPPIPPLMRAPLADKPILLVHAAVRADIVGSLATTRIELSFLNPNHRQLEGELEFPLGAGQSVSAFALEALDGSTMLQAVPVEKAKGRQVFEDIERRNTDPALLEQTAGNQFRLRVYPLLPLKPRKLSLEISEILHAGKDGRLVYRPPLSFGGTIAENLDLSIQVHGVTAKNLRLSSTLAGALVGNQDGSGRLMLSKKRFRGLSHGELSWQAPHTPSVFAAQFEDEGYFLAEIPFKSLPQARPMPRRISLIWDASGSGAQRDHDKEMALLEAWFKGMDEAQVSLKVVRERAEAALPFPIRKGDWQGLRTYLTKLVYDGASQGAAWRPGREEQCDLAVVFTDGLSNWGDDLRMARPEPLAPCPLYAISAVDGAHAPRLRALAEENGGQYLDLMQLDSPAAARELQLRRPRVTQISAEGLSDGVLSSVYPQQDRLIVAGRIRETTRSLRLTLETADGRHQEKVVAIPAHRRSAAIPGEVLARHWATLRIAQLEAAPHLHRAEILRLGESYRLVSSETALIVLESLADHLRYGVRPAPGPWQMEYDAKRIMESRSLMEAQARHREALLTRFQERSAWWDKDFPKDAPPPPPKTAKKSSMDGDRRVAAMAAPLAMNHTPPAPMATPRREADAPSAGAAAIHMQKWQADTPYAKRLREASNEERYAIYLDEKPSHAQSSAFFVDAAEVFFDKGQQELALRVLSNLAELQLENRALLRILAYRLLQAKEPGLAVPLFERVKTIAPDEPQSWRDLGLAYEAAGRYQDAVDSLWQAANMNLDGRYADIDLIALVELNALAARHAGLDLRALDPRLVRNMPLDLRVILAWDTDNSDMDLWVTDPNGEKAFYGHALTYQGGHMSRDATGGYGPEEFALKVAKPGRYEVRAKFYGSRQQVLSPHTTLMLKLSTGFGRAEQKDQSVILRLKEAKDEVLVGSFEVGTPSKP